MLPHLQERVVSVEDQLIGQNKAHEEAVADTACRVTTLDWRLSVTERRLAAAETALQRSLAAMQLQLFSMLAAIGVRFAPVAQNVVAIVTALAAAMVLAALLEARAVLHTYLNLRVRTPASPALTCFSCGPHKGALLTWHTVHVRSNASGTAQTTWERCWCCR